MTRIPPESVSQASQTDDLKISSSADRMIVEWNIRSILDTVLRVHDALTYRSGDSIPLHPEEVANLLQLKKFVDGATKYALRRCLCDSVYCRSPEKLMPCVINPNDAMKDQSLIYKCKWRGKKL